MFLRLSDEERDGVVNRARYAGYIEKQQREAQTLRDDESLRIPAGFHFERPGLSAEVVEKLQKVRPASLGQAARIPGVTPAAVAVLRMNLRYETRGASGTPRGADDLP
jgi:tRNA uridine 5-carboxymethylaminomethyl modification enzyme